MNTIDTKKAGRFMSARRRDHIFVWLMLAFPLAQFLVFYIGTNVGAWLMAFQMPKGETTVWTTLNFENFFQDLFDPLTETRVMLFNTLKIFLVSDFVILPLGILFSYILYSKIPLSGFYRVVFFLPSIISAVAMTMIFMYNIEQGGPLSALFKVFGLKLPVMLGQEHAFKTILLYNIWATTGYQIVVLSGSIARIPQELFESASIDGAGFIRIFFVIAVPLMWPTVSMLFVLNIAGMFSYMGPVLLLTNGAHKTSTIAFFIFKNVQSSGRYNYPAAVGFVFSLVGTPLVFTVKYFMDKLGEAVEF